jgi:hypothetical protein
MTYEPLGLRRIYGLLGLGLSVHGKAASIRGFSLW